ncbi:HipA domain-containing protein [Nocardioides sp. AN3]
MSITRPDALDVHVALPARTVHAGTVTFRYRGATTTTEFTYSATYLATRGAYAVDPALPLARATAIVEGLPAAFSDSTPDWWGRQLVSRTLRLEASAAGRQPPLLTEPDYLVAVSDQTRQGNLRFAAPGTTAFLDPGASIPKLVSLPELLEASDRVAANDDAGAADALKILLAAGSATLGGARPKASVQDEGQLLIAKFPFREDEWDVMAWEKTVLDLAEHCGIDVPERRLVDVSGRQVLLVSRFDRDPAGGRIGYVSARTLAEVGSSASNDYLDLVAAIEDHSSNAVDDLHALWTRIAFTVATNNTDDHFNNHGFCRARGGWTLAPAFDININPQLAQPRTSTLAGADNRERTLQTLVRESAYFGLAEGEARDGLLHISDRLNGWRDVARANGVPDRELDTVGWVLDDYRDRVAAHPRRGR